MAATSGRLAHSADRPTRIRNILGGFIGALLSQLSANNNSCYRPQIAERTNDSLDQKLVRFLGNSQLQNQWKFPMKNISRIVLVTLTLALCPAKAMANTVGHGEGGTVRDFATIVDEYNTSGKPFRIDSHCQSACTMFLGIRNVCVTRGARLYFHAGHNRHWRQRGLPQIHLQTTAMMKQEYKSSLVAYLNEHGYMDTVDFHMIPGSDLIDKFGYHECGKR